MSYAPKSISDLSAYWEQQGGVPLGIVGNNAHCGGYHLGADRIYSDCACKPSGACVKGQRSNDYSVQYSRDKKGLSNAASAIDLGKLNKSLHELRKFSRWLVARCQNDATVRHLVREIIYSPDGQKVQRYSGADNVIYVGPGNGDSSHTTHTHISFWRDTQRTAKVGLFAPYFESVPDTSTGDQMGLKIEDNKLIRIAVEKGRAIYDLAGNKVNEAPQDLQRTVFHKVQVDGDPDHHYYVGQFPGGGPGADLLMVRAGPAEELPPPGDTTPFGQDDLDAAYNSGLNDAVDAIDGIARK